MTLSRAKKNQKKEKNMKAERILLTCLSFFMVAIFSSLPLFSAQSPLQYISNNTIRLGINTAWGGGIGYFSHMVDIKNVINRYDVGRNIQQSFYGKPNGLKYRGIDWWYNPVQGGDQYNNPSTVIVLKNWGDSFYVRTSPKDWARNNVTTTDIMEQWITLRDDVAQIVYRYTYTGPGENYKKNQEVPAPYFVYDLSTLAYYKNGGYVYKTRSQIPTGPDPGHDSNSENWVAYVTNPSTSGWGCGVLTPHTNYFEYHRSEEPGFGNSDVSPNTNYVGPILKDVDLHKNYKIQYRCYFKIGNLSDIRSRLLDVKNNGLNLALNGGFENGSSSNPHEWFIGTDNGGTHTYHTSGGAYVAEGTDSVALTADSNGSTWILPYWGQYQYGVTGGTKYRISFKAKCEQLNAGTAGIRIIQYRRGGAYISDSGIIAASELSGTHSAFQSKSFTFTTAANTAIIEIRLQLNSKGDWARVWFDSVRFSLNTP
jgi:hypothetical protein